MKIHRAVRVVCLGLVLATIVSLLMVSAPIPLNASVSSKTTSTDSFQGYTNAPCEGGSTRTPTSTATITATYDLRSPTPTDTSTHYPLFRMVRLVWPVNCAVLHTNSVPNFQFYGADMHAPFLTTLQLNGPVGGTIEYGDGWRDTVSNIGEKYLPDGIYSWKVISVKFDSLASASETWVFRIDTSCGCTDTPTATFTSSAIKTPTFTPTGR